MIVFNNVHLNALQTVMAAAASPTAKGNQILAYYLLALLMQIGRAPRTELSQLQDMRRALGNKAKPVFNAIKAGTAPDYALDPVFSDAQKRVCRLIGRVASDPNGGKLPELLRVAGQIAPSLAKYTLLKPKPTTGLRGADKQKADLRYLKDLCIDLVRKGSKTDVLLSELDKASGTAAFTRAIPAKFRKDIKLDETGALFYNGEQLVSRALSPVTIWVLRNAKPTLPTRELGEGGYLFGYVPKMSAGGVQKIYKLSSVQKANEKKWQAVDKFTETLPKLQTAWERLLRANDGLGALLQFAFLTSARIGNPSSSDSGKYGITTLVCRHVKPRANGIVVSYMGKGSKGGVPQKHVITGTAPETRLLVKWVNERLKHAKPADPLFTHKVGDGPDGRITAPEVNAWLKSKTGGMVTAHKFRHVRGTTLAIEVLKKVAVPKNASLTGITKLFKTSMEQVGAALGHYNLVGEDSKVTPMTAIKNYIAPQVGIEFFKKHGFEPPVNLFPSLKFGD